jgi:hypothetical protein
MSTLGVLSAMGTAWDVVSSAGPIINGGKAIANLGATAIDLAAGDIDGARDHSIDAAISGVKMIPGIGLGVTAGQYIGEAFTDNNLHDMIEHDVYGEDYQPAQLQQPVSDEERALAIDEGRRYDDSSYDMMRKLGMSPEQAAELADLRARVDEQSEE